MSSFKILLLFKVPPFVSCQIMLVVCKKSACSPASAFLLSGSMFSLICILRSEISSASPPIKKQAFDTLSLLIKVQCEKAIDYVVLNVSKSSVQLYRTFSQCGSSDTSDLATGNDGIIHC